MPPGPPTWTSEASTGSVGASTAPSRRAAAGASPTAHQPISATEPMHSGMAIGQQPPGRRPAAPGPALEEGERTVQGQAHPHQRHQHGQLGDVLDRGPVGLRVQRQPVGQRGQADQHADAHQHHRGRDRPAAQQLGQHHGEEETAARQEVRQVGSHTPPYPPLPPRLPCPIPHPPSRRRCTPHDPRVGADVRRPTRAECDARRVAQCAYRRPARCPRCGRHPGSGSPVTGPAPRRPSRWRRCSRAGRAGDGQRQVERRRDVHGDARGGCVDVDVQVRPG